MAKCKVTVLRRMSNQDLIEEYRLPEFVQRYPAPCEMFQDNQEFILDNWAAPPEGFCPWAWSDIHKEIMLIFGGGDNFSFKEKGVTIACCTDGFKPVVFKIERVQE